MKYLSKKSTSGYSLIELIVVLVLIGMLSAIATPLLISTIMKTQLKTSAKELATTFRYARSQAISTKKPYYFYVDLDNSSYWISSDVENAESEGTFDAETVRKAATNIRSTSKEIMIKKVDAALSTMNEGIVEIPFYPQGNTINVIVYLEKRNESNSDRNYEIHLDEITGKVKIIKR
jgi:type II secretion system protein H